MTDAPDMIWTAPTKSRCLVGFPEPSLNYSVPYRRADLPRPEDAQRIAELEAALKCALALCDTPIARRRLGIDPNNCELLDIARAALSGPAPGEGE